MASEGPAAARDRALLLLGYAGAFRRAELVAVSVEGWRFSEAGLYVRIAAVKNDPRKAGRLYVPRPSRPYGIESTVCSTNCAALKANKSIRVEPRV